MMKRLLSFIVTAFAFTALSAQENCVPVYAKNEKDVAFVAGEKMSFVLHYKFGIINSDIGTAEISLDTVRSGGVKTFHCRVCGRTTKFYDCFFKVREDFNSWFACDGLLPVRFTRDTYEGRYVAKNDYSYFWDSSKPYIDASIYTSSSGDMVKKLPLKPCTFDLPSLFFFARNIDMKRVRKDVKYPMTFAIDDDIYDVYFIYRGKCTVDVKGLGRVNCLKFAAKLLEGAIFKGDNDMDIYISDDLNRLPVLFGASIRVGDVEGRMVDCSGLKYPFTALIDGRDIS